jgi:hypothetical protein
MMSSKVERRNERRNDGDEPAAIRYCSEMACLLDARPAISSQRVENVFSRVFLSAFLGIKRPRQLLPACAIDIGKTSGSERSQRPLGGKQAAGEKLGSQTRRTRGCAIPQALACCARMLRWDNAFETRRFLRLSLMPRRLGMGKGTATDCVRV